MRRKQRRRANRRYQQDPEIRADHCQRQWEYRERCHWRSWDLCQPTFLPHVFGGPQWSLAAQPHAIPTEWAEVKSVLGLK